MRSRALLLMAALMAVSAHAAKPQIQWDPEYDFTAVHTFQWQMPPGESLAEADPFLHSRIMNAIQYELTGYGLTEVESDPDVFVTYHASSERSLRMDSTSYGYSFGGYGYGRWGMYGYGMGPVDTTTRVYEVERGTLVVDVWDAATRQLVWRGSMADITISDDPQKNQRNAEKAIQKMAKQYRKLRARER